MALNNQRMYEVVKDGLKVSEHSNWRDAKIEAAKIGGQARPTRRSGASAVS